MEKSVEISKELDGKVEFANGMARISFDYHGKIGGAGAYVFVTSDEIIDALCKAIPGEIDNKLGELLKAALKKA